MDVWPASTNYSTFTDFFKDCISEEWLGDDFTFSYMAAPGLQKAETIDPTLFTANNNAWCIVVDAGHDLHAESPFMFTRNFVASGGGTTLSDIDMKPFNDAIGVIITFGGAMKIVRKKDAKKDMQAFFNPLDSKKEFIRP